jgi:hypothetical protein
VIIAAQVISFSQERFVRRCGEHHVVLIEREGIRDGVSDLWCVPGKHWAEWVETYDQVTRRVVHTVNVMADECPHPPGECTCE